MARVRNILFITSDQQRWDTLPAYGVDWMHTPNLDRLSREGMTFDNCTAISPVCQPARAAFMLGQYPHVTGVGDNFQWIRPDSPTIARRFNEAGWNTAAIGKMHFDPWDNPEGFQYRVIAEDKRHIFRRDDWTKALEKAGFARSHPATIPGYRKNLGAIVSPLPEELHIDSFIASEGVNWLSKHAASPFFAWISFNSPHDPYDPPERLANLYRNAPIPEPVGSPAEWPTKPGYQHEVVKFYNSNPLFLTNYNDMSSAQIRRMREHYFATITLIDDQVGRVIDALEQSGQLEDTLIVFSSDHGDNLGDHGLPFKSNYYEGALRVPLIVWGPGIPAGTRNSSPVNWLDLHATFLKTAGLEVPDHVQGIDLSPIFEDPELVLKDVAFSELQGSAMVRTDRYKLVVCDDGSGEFYDLKEQPLEVHNHFGEPAYAEHQKRLTDALVRHLLGHSNVKRFGGGRHAPDPERLAGFREIERQLKAGELTGLE